MNSKYPKIAFIGWNPFQLIHVTELIKRIPNSTFILEDKHNSQARFSKDLLSEKEVPIKVYKSKDIHKLDDLFDIIICQTVFTDIQKFKKAKIAMIQYGYAKEAHNYGPWRSLADICFTYGPYASNKISYFCPTVEIGFLRKREVFTPEFINKAKIKYQHLIDPKKKTVLYLPTWGDYDSSDEYLYEIYSMQEKYNVLIKMHHNTDLIYLSNNKNLIKLKSSVLGANDDSLQLIMLSDIIISDYSGAIFDGIFCKKPIVLLTLNLKLKSQTQKVDNYSLEYRCRNELGYIVDSPEELSAQIEVSIHEAKLISEKLYNDLFINSKDPYSIINNSLYELANNNNIELTQTQLYTRDALKQLYTIKYSNLYYKLFNTLNTIYSKLTNIRFKKILK